MNALEAAMVELARAETTMARADRATERQATVCTILRDKRQPYELAEFILREMRMENERMETTRKLILDRIELIRAQGGEPTN